VMGIETVGSFSPTDSEGKVRVFISGA